MAVKVKAHGALTTVEGGNISVEVESTSFKECISLCVKDIDGDMTVSHLTEQEAKALINCMAQAIRALG